jgi:SAM-dependent methyltransferase
MITQVDLGCGNAKRPEPGVEKCIGIDVMEKEGVDRLCVLGFESIPLEDNSVDIVTAHDLLEHIPFVFYRQDPYDSPDAPPKQIMPMVFLFNEIYRILKPMGQFKSSTPFYPHSNIFQDPTHVSIWTGETIRYYSGDYYGRHDDWGHTSRFELTKKNVENDHLKVILIARKDMDGKAHNYFIGYPLPEHEK